MKSKYATAVTLAAITASVPALAHDGLHDHADPHRLPDFAIIAQDPGYVARRSAMLGASAFTLVGLPDTQNYSSSYPQIFASQTNWVQLNATALDIQYVSHYGDIVNNADQAFQWVNADNAMRVLDDMGIPYGVCPGNHDFLSSGGSGQPFIPQNYLNYFGPSRFAGEPWYVGSSPSGLSMCTTFRAGGIDFLQIHLACDTPVAELSWAQAILDRNRHVPAMLTTHRYLQDAEDYTGGVPLVSSGRYPDIWYAAEGLYDPNGIRSEEFWRWFVRRNTNVFMVTCGHFHEEYRQVSTNVAGRPVHEVLADYQDDPNGGDGWMRIMRFDTAAGVIDVDTYSPTLGAIRTAEESDFNLAVDFAAYTLPGGVSFKAFHQGINGYQGTQDTWVNQQSPNSSYGNNDTRTSDDDVANSFFSDFRGQALLRFDGIVGPGAIPAGSEVLSARLFIDVSNDIDTPLFNPRFDVHRVIRAWDENSTWNSLSGGLTVGQDLAPREASFSGDNSPDGDGMRIIDLTNMVRAWVAGEQNWGIAILPEIISGNDDGIEIRTSENGNVILRPRLEVTFRAPPAPGNPADLDRSGSVDGVDLGIFLATWGATTGPTDLNGDGSVDGTDLGLLLAAWGN
jgi:hypothetical protein